MGQVAPQAPPAGILTSARCLSAAEFGAIKAEFERAHAGTRTAMLHPIVEYAQLAAQAKCEYCGRFGPLGQCDGCGAANAPVFRRPTFSVQVPAFDKGMH